MRAVNLLPHDEATQRRQLGLSPQNAPVLLGAGLGILVTGALALGFMHESSAVSSAQQQLQQAKTQLAATPKPPPATAVQAQPNAQLVGEQSARVTAVSTALGARFAWDRILREFSLVLPDDVWLTSLTFQGAATSAAAPAAGSLTISGSTYSHDSVARLLARIALIPELSNVSLQSDSTGGAAAAATGPGAAPAAAKVVGFTITATVNLPAGATSLTAPPPPPPPAPTDTSGTTTTGSTS